MRNRSAGFIKRLFVENLMAKSMALAMALVLWVYAYNFSIARNVTFNVPVDAPAPEGWSVDPTFRREVTVLIDVPQRFEAKLKRAFQARKLVIKCDLSKQDLAGPDEQFKSIQLEWSRHMPGLDNFDVGRVTFNPPSLEIKLVRHTSTKLTVNIRSTPPPNGWEFAKPLAISPSSVLVSGRKDILDRAKSIDTELINIKVPDVEDADWDDEGKTRIRPKVEVDGKLYEVICAEELTYTYRLARPMRERTFKDVPVHLRVPNDYAFKVEPSKGAMTRVVTVTGPKNKVEQFKAEFIELYITPPANASGDVPETLTVQSNIVSYQSRRGLTLKIEPASMDVLIIKR
jgi:hypothetical protein